MRVKSMPDAAFFSRSVTDDRPPGGVSGSSVVIVVKGEKEEGKKNGLWVCVREPAVSSLRRGAWVVVQGEHKRGGGRGCDWEGEVCGIVVQVRIADY